MARPPEGRKRTRVLALLAAYEDGGAAPELTELAARLDLAPRKVGALLQRLEADGLITAQRRHSGAPRTVYRVALHGSEARA